MKRQFSIKLQPYDGQYHNFFAYGAFERMLERARLVDRIEFGEDKCILVFEEDVPVAQPIWKRWLNGIGAVARGRRGWIWFRKTSDEEKRPNDQDQAGDGRPARPQTR